jgi:hypothetical protein
MTIIQGAESLSNDELAAELDRGGKVVVFEYCISILVMTFKRPSEPHFIRAGEGAFGKALPYVLLSLTCGWWGIPWGPIYTIASLITNLGGGRDVTRDVRSVLGPAQLAAREWPVAASLPGAPGGHAALPPAPGLEAPPATPLAPQSGAYGADVQSGARVLVQWSDGQRYPATVVQVAPGQCLVALHGGQQQWVASSNVCSA